MVETNTSIPDYPRGITFEQVWAAQMETDRQIKEFKEQIKESQEKTDRQIEEMSKQLGGLGNSIGGLIETLVAARLWENFSAYPYGFDRAYRRLQVFDEVSKKELTDIDILLYNTEWVMAVEVKRDLDIKDVERHIKRMKLICGHPPLQVQGKKLLGALAGGTVESEARGFAYEFGFFVLELRGESVELIPPPEGFVPKKW